VTRRPGTEPAPRSRASHRHGASAGPATTPDRPGTRNRTGHGDPVTAPSTVTRQSGTGPRLRSADRRRTVTAARTGGAPRTGEMLAPRRLLTLAALGAAPAKEAS
jgi:hypothetical protein